MLKGKIVIFSGHRIIISTSLGTTAFANLVSESFVIPSLYQGITNENFRSIGDTNKSKRDTTMDVRVWRPLAFG